MAKKAVKIRDVIARLDAFRGKPGHVQNEHINEIVNAHSQLLRCENLDRDSYDRAMSLIVLSSRMLFDLVEWSAKRRP